MTDAEREAWLSSLKVGDEVVIRSRFLPLQTAVVTRVQKIRLELRRDDQVVIACRRSDGSLCGDYSTRPHIEAMTPSAARTVRLQRLRVWVTDLLRRMEASSDIAMLEALKEAHDKLIADRERPQSDFGKQTQPQV